MIAASSNRTVGSGSPNFKVWAGILLIGILTSLYFFPVIFKAFPSQNTKNLLGAVGIVFLFMTLVYRRRFEIPKEIIFMFFISAGVSLISLVSMVYNQTPDNSYASFIRSTAIWFCGAYALALLIRIFHGKIEVSIILNYLVAVCLFQCAAAMLIEYNHGFQEFVDSHIEQGQDLLQGLNRLYGIGASLDVAGSRFAAVLTAIAVYIDLHKKDLSASAIFVYIIAFIIITVIGNMIARTTLIGVVLGLTWIGFRWFQSLMRRESQAGNKIIRTWGMALLVMVPISAFLYTTNDTFKDLFRFGFEGFFNLVENGEWDVSSTNKLETMVVFPEELETWIIGDGYFENSRNDINYLGDATEDGFYMGTDIGYLRFIFYFGVIGLLLMCLMVIYATIICANGFPEDKSFFFMVMLVNFIVWLKVSTDILLFFYLFIAGFVVANSFPPDEIEEDVFQEDNLEE